MKAKVILFVTAAAIILSCAVKRATLNSYTDPGFNSGKIKKVAVFPIKNARFAPGDAQQINRKICTAIKQNNPGIEIVSPAAAVRLLNENKLADDWGYFLDNYLFFMWIKK